MRSLRKTRLLAMCTVPVMLCSCGPSEPVARVDAPPPPPPPANQTAGTYDYTHTVARKANKAMARRMVVALVRFDEDRPLDDEQIPFGPGTQTAPAPDDGPIGAQIEVQVDGNRAEGTMVMGKLSKEMSLRARAMLKHELMESESFVVVERDQILDILREQKFGQTGYVHPVGTPETGKLMGVQYLLDGSVGLNEDLTYKNTTDAPPDYKETDRSMFDKIFSPNPSRTQSLQRSLREQQKRWVQAGFTHVTNPYGVYLYLYSAKTGELVVDAYGIGTTRQMAIRDAVDELVDKCRDLVNPPTIVAIDGDRIIIDTGSIDDIVVGQRFRYLTLGKPVYNSAGQKIGDLEDEGGELEVTQVQELMSITRITREVAPPAIGGRVEPIE